MSDQILAALTRIEERIGGLEAGQSSMEARQSSLEAGQSSLSQAVERMNHVSERMELKLDRLSDDMADVKVGLNAMETISANKSVIAATQAGQINRLETRLALVERRLEIRDR
jgi:chromosome segregation ATPase